MSGARHPNAGLEVRRDLTWHPSALAREDRWLAIDQRGATVLLTGLSASGKSTIAVALERQLVSGGQSAYLLDGDNIRHGLSDDLGFSTEDRAEHIRRVGQVARLMADSGTVSVLSLIAPMASDRQHLRDIHTEAGLPFVEVFVDTPVEECARRDPKGLYARALAGEIKNFTGIDAPYERPEHPEIHVDTMVTDVPAAVSQIIGVLRSRDASVLTQGATLRISVKADAAVRVSAELAAAGAQGGLTAAQIGEAQSLPIPFVELLLAELSIRRIVSSEPGPERTFHLARSADQITVADVMRAVEGPLSSVRGIRPEEATYAGAATELPRVWIAVRQNFRGVVETVTLADVVASRLPEAIERLASDSEAWITR